jgi:hypothetical protein
VNLSRFAENTLEAVLDLRLRRWKTQQLAELREALGLARDASHEEALEVAYQAQGALEAEANSGETELDLLREALGSICSLVEAPRGAFAVEAPQYVARALVAAEAKTMAARREYVRLVLAIGGEVLLDEAGEMQAAEDFDRVLARLVRFQATSKGGAA